MYLVNDIWPAPQMACMTRRGLVGVFLADLDKSAIVEDATDRKAVVEDVGDDHFEKRQEDALGGLAHEVVFHGGLPTIVVG